MAEKPIERIGSTSDIIPVAVNVTKKTSEETNSDATISLEDNQFIDNETGGVEVDSKKKKGSDVSKKNKKRKSEVVIKLPKKPKRDPVVSEIVWAKISSYPWWPAQVLEPSEQHIKIRHKKTDHFVVFFGDGNCMCILNGWLIITITNYSFFQVAGWINPKLILGQKTMRVE